MAAEEHLGRVTRNSSWTRWVLLGLFFGSVLFGIGVIYKLGTVVQSIQTSEQSDPLWVASQLQFEVLRLENELVEVAHTSTPVTTAALRFDIAWSRINVLQEGRVSQLMDVYGLDRAVLQDLEATFEVLEPKIALLDSPRTDVETRQATAREVHAALDGYDLMLKEFMLDLAQSRTASMAGFRTGLMSLSHAIVYLGVTILALLASFTILLMIEVRVARRTEHKMRVLAQEATSASRMKMNFMSVVSHELRTPLTSILGGLSLLRARMSETVQDETAHKLLNVASRNGERLLTLVNDILDAQALSEGKVSVAREPEDLTEVVEAAVEGCQPYADKLGVGFRVVTPGGPMMALTDNARLTQVLTNLISNAAKFTTTGDEVEIRLIRKGGRARIEVADNGIGIPVERQGDIFVPFHQINPGTTGANKSSGLGLSITKQLMDLLGGKIGFSSVENEGSVFWVEMDLMEEVRHQPQQLAVAS